MGWGNAGYSGIVVEGRGNTARDGGAIFVRGSGELRIVFSEFRRNAARARGGAVNYSDIEFIDFQNVFANNTAVLGPGFADLQASHFT